MWSSDIRTQIIADFVECAQSPCSSADRAKPLVTFRPVKTPRGNAIISRELGSNVRRIVRFPHPVKPAEPKQAG